jgi:ubiquinone/menaquinone biosynthesis C-methylase UbiE
MKSYCFNISPEKDRNILSVATYNACAEKYAEVFMDISPYHDRIDEWCRRINIDSPMILDLGCGPGNISRYLRDRWDSPKITGIDLAEEMIRIARKTAPSVKFICEDARKIEFPDNSFDGIIVSFCIPYLSLNETSDLIRKVAKILKPGGALYLSCMEGNRQGPEATSFSEGRLVYIYYYEACNIYDLLSINGFQRISTFKQDYREQDGATSTDLIFIASKK